MLASVRSGPQRRTEEENREEERAIRDTSRICRRTGRTTGQEFGIWGDRDE
jgi:hypothetical protein